MPKIVELRNEKVYIMANVKSGTIKLSQDLATLLNNRQGSDIQFKVGGGGTSTLQENGKTIYDESSTVTLYAHSVILRCRSRYFATMLDEEKNWRESSKGVIYKPNISLNIFKDVLHYIYTGNVPAKTSENIIELISAADEMDLEELSVGCQTELIRTVKHIFSDEDNSDDEKENIGETLEGSTKQHIPIDVAIRTHIIPALNLASSHSLSHLSQKLLTVVLPNMSIIVKSPDAYTTFINNISSESLTKIIASDNLAMMEKDIWDLALRWGCHQTNLEKTTVDACLASFKDDEGDNKESLGGPINDTQLSQLKTTLAPFLPFIRFSLLEPDDYAQIVIILSYFLPSRRIFDLTQHFISTTHTRQLDTPRMERLERGVSSNIVAKSVTWEILRKSIFEAGGIAGCLSFKHLKFDLLFRASEHDFSSKSFHECCDNKGPTLTLVKSDDGHLFGGVNFVHWNASNSYSSSPKSFLFALPDGHHRKNTLIFKNTNSSTSCYNGINHGPIFGGGFDLCIKDYANSNSNSYSGLPRSYNGIEASDTALAGTRNFVVSDYEVFVISKI